jgi:valyl-tRNA synthetase
MDGLSKSYEPASIEADSAQRWRDNNCFRAQPDARPADQRFSIVIPPPNVTGALHLGHALNNTLQDTLVRWHRMRGDNTLWVPGTDHAGIATQAVVEKRLREEEGKSRHDIGREAMVQRIWAWKDQYEARIVRQLQQMGCSCDFSRIRFTLDDGCSRAVRQTFFKMFEAGHVFRGKRLVNWDCELQTAVADDEVNHETVKGKFYHFKYPVENPAAGEPEFVCIATTRPETMLADTAVAVHPDPAAALDKIEAEIRRKIDKASDRERKGLHAAMDALKERRETHLATLVKLRDMAQAGRMVTLPLTGRRIPLVCDHWAKPDLGSGCVKITPAHDPNDYQVAQRHGLPMVNVLTRDGCVAPIVEPDGAINACSGQYEGLRFSTEGRARVLADLDAGGYVEDIEDRKIEIAHSDRSKSPIEPLLSDQWFMRMDTSLTDDTLAAVSSDSVRFHPQRYKNAYLDWLSEKRDWCISRQLWWGHRIPVWMRTVEAAEATAERRQEFDGLVRDHADVCMKVFEDHAGPRPTVTFAVCILSPDSAAIAAIESAGFECDGDVLDTWFSSALWPHSTLGWPEHTADLAYYYPTSVLITSRDIITLWVVRMVLTGLANMEEHPFQDVYIHPKILDGRGETMSKSKGNGVDPVDIIEAYGADALRYGLVAMTTESQDIRMPVNYLCPHSGEAIPQTDKNMFDKNGRPTQVLHSPHADKPFATRWADEATQKELGLGLMVSDKFESARNLMSKLWNAARFAFMNLDGEAPKTLDLAKLQPEDRWVLAELSDTVRAVNHAMSNYHYSRVAQHLRGYFWDVLCDWYLELLKYRFREDHQPAEARQVLAVCFDQILRLMHPVVPFVTERLWQQLNITVPQRGLPGVMDLEPSPLLTLAPFPPAAGYPALDNDDVKSTFHDLRDATRAIREARSSAGMSPKDPMDVTIATSLERTNRLQHEAHILVRLAGVKNLTISDTALRPSGSAVKIIGELRIFVHGVVDDAEERGRLEKQIKQLEGRARGAEGKLSNPGYLKSAPTEVVEETRGILEGLRNECAVLQEVLTLLGDGEGT